jgi:hypothetical protein
MPNFQNGKIYSIRSHQTDKIYIGSTTQSLAVRFGGHKRMNCTSREILVFDDAYIELIENYPCADKNELHRREGEIIRTIECVNKRIAGRTLAEYYEDNKEDIKQYNKQYQQDNKEEKKQYNKQYYEDNKEDNKETRKQYSKQYYEEHTEEAKQYSKQYQQAHKESIAAQKKQYWHTHKNRLTCSCGVEYNSGNTRERNRHYGSKLHIKFVNDFYERLHQLVNLA